ncbi:MAG: hypothetical protein GY696_06395, partial [Gammaproteobacteria bacterium]|nr:hypothetical protein [Gammaproteobacteria bacterium]
VEVDLGYRVQLKPELMVHTFAPVGLTGRQIFAEGILTTGADSVGSRVQLVNLAPYDQRILKGATLCSAMVTKGHKDGSRKK